MMRHFQGYSESVRREWAPIPDETRTGAMVARGGLHVVVAIVVAAPSTPIPLVFLPALVCIAVAYFAPAEITKRWFFRREDQRLGLAGVSAPRSPETLGHTLKS